MRIDFIYKLRRKKLGNMPQNCRYTSFESFEPLSKIQWFAVKEMKGTEVKGTSVLVHVTPVKLYICCFCN